jgi:peptidoglycan/LPS O-acetylase OafA/YrhL
VFLYLGKISYTLYLTHFAAIYLLTKYKILNLILSYNQFTAILNFVINYLMVLVTSILLSTVLYYTIESPMQKVEKKIHKALIKPPFLKQFETLALPCNVPLLLPLLNHTLWRNIRNFCLMGNLLYHLHDLLHLYIMV